MFHISSLNIAVATTMEIIASITIPIAGKGSGMRMLLITINKISQKGHNRIIAMNHSIAVATHSATIFIIILVIRLISL